MLNFDELTVVWQFIPIGDIVCQRLVSREWNENIIHNNILWHHLCDYYLRNDLFRFDQDDEIKLLIDQFDEEDSTSEYNIEKNTCSDHHDSQFYYQLFRTLYFFPKITALRKGKYNIDEIKIMSLPNGFEKFYNVDEYSGRVSRFGFVAMLISCLAGKENDLVQLNYLNDRIKIGNSDGKVVKDGIPLCSLFAAIIFTLPQLSGLFGEEIMVLTPKRLPRCERFPVFCDLWYAFEDKLSLDNTLEWEVDDDREIFPYFLNVNYSIFKKVKIGIEFTSDWKELVLEVGFWLDH